MAGVGTVLSGGILPEAMVISGAVSAGTVSGVDWLMNGSVDPKNVISAYWVGALTRYTGFEATMAIKQQAILMARSHGQEDWSVVSQAELAME